MDERRLGYIDGREDSWEEGHEKSRAEGLKDAIMALKGTLEPTVIADQFKLSLEQVMDILSL